MVVEGRRRIIIRQASPRVLDSPYRGFESLDSLEQFCGLSLPTLKSVRLAHAIVPSRRFIACRHCQHDAARAAPETD
jgi:hypothetical protein